MLFDHLLFDALVPGKTLAEDKGHGSPTSADFRPTGDETVLLFRIDDDQTKKRLGLTGQKCCDSLYFVKNKTDSLLILVELKGSDSSRAKEQILGTFTAIHKNSEHVRRGTCKVYAVIVTLREAPRNLTEMKKKLRQKGIQLQHVKWRGRACDLRSELKLN